MTWTKTKVRVQKTPKRWTAGEDARLVQMFRAGMMMRDIAETLRVTVGQVTSHIQHLRKAGVELPHRVPPVDVSRLNEIK